MKRHELINRITFLASDDYKTVEDCLSLARLTKKELKIVYKYVEQYERKIFDKYINK